MKKVIAKILVIVILLSSILSLTSCETASQKDMSNTKDITNNLVSKQSTPSDITYSLQRYNLIRRAYWMNGMEEKARSLPCEVTKPLGYIYCFVPGIGCVIQNAVDGQLTSLRTYLTPDSTDPNSVNSEWLADVDGTYGENQDAIFYFDTSGEYHEWKGLYYYSSTYYEIDEVILKIQNAE